MMLAARPFHLLRLRSPKVLRTVTFYTVRFKEVK